MKSGYCPYIDKEFDASFSLTTKIHNHIHNLQIMIKLMRKQQMYPKEYVTFF